MNIRAVVAFCSVRIYDHGKFAGPSGGAGTSLFGPQFMAKLAMNPETRPYLEQPDFKQMLAMVGQNPQMMTSFMQVCIVCDSAAAHVLLGQHCKDVD